MPSPQQGIFAEDSSHHHYLEYDIPEGSEKHVARALAGALEDGDVHVVVAFGPDSWPRIAPGDNPEGLGAFAPIDGAGHHAAATQHDLFVWVHGKERDRVVERVLRIHTALRSAEALLGYEESGFRYLDSRDLTGFVDGSANPKGPKAFEAALVPDSHPGAAGSHVLVQRWVHDLESFGDLKVEEQERVIGRTKPDSIELEGDAMPDNSHVSRNDVSSMKIYRRSAPFGGAGEHGLQFLAFGADRERFDGLLARMYGTSGDGLSDSLLGFSRAMTGAYYFAPSSEEMAEACKA